MNSTKRKCDNELISNKKKKSSLYQFATAKDICSFHDQLGQFLNKRLEEIASKVDNGDYSLDSELIQLSLIESGDPKVYSYMSDEQVHLGIPKTNEWQFAFQQMLSKCSPNFASIVGYLEKITLMNQLENVNQHYIEESEEESWRVPIGKQSLDEGKKLFTQLLFTFLTATNILGLCLPNYTPREGCGFYLSETDQELDYPILAMYLDVEKLSIKVKKGEPILQLYGYLSRRTYFPGYATYEGLVESDFNDPDEHGNQLTVLSSAFPTQSGWNVDMVREYTSTYATDRKLIEEFISSVTMNEFHTNELVLILPLIKKLSDVDWLNCNLNHGSFKPEAFINLLDQMLI